jgi:hypothetical protein
MNKAYKRVECRLLSVRIQYTFYSNAFFHLKKCLLRGYSKPWNNLYQALEQTVQGIRTCDTRHSFVCVVKNQAFQFQLFDFVQIAYARPLVDYFNSLTKVKATKVDYFNSFDGNSSHLNPTPFKPR